MTAHRHGIVSSLKSGANDHDENQNRRRRSFGERRGRGVRHDKRYKATAERDGDDNDRRSIMRDDESGRRLLLSRIALLQRRLMLRGTHRTQKVGVGFDAESKRRGALTSRLSLTWYAIRSDS
jgi:hypothetical protein